MTRYSQIVFVTAMALLAVFGSPLILGNFLANAVSVNAAEIPDRVDQQWDYIDNGLIRIGVDRSRGACIGFLAESQTKRNLLNHFDTGRFIQQSYYGAADGSNWNGKPWVYNPVQGGNWKRKASRILDFKRDRTKQTLYAKVEPLRWSSGVACPEAIMEQTITLNQSVARIHYRMTYTGEDQSVVKSQEMPAVFVDAQLQQLVYVEQGELKRRVPKWPNEPGRSTQHWVAYVNDRDWGIGIYTPGTDRFTCYRAKGNGQTGPAGSACSYVAPLRRFSLQNGLTVEYDVYLTIGSLSDIRKRFAALRKKFVNEADKTQSHATIPG